MNTTDSPRPLLYNRQKLLFYILENVPSGLSKIDIHKLMLLYMKDMKCEHYDFVPYMYGGYSFVLANDLHILARRGWIKEDLKDVRPRREVLHEAREYECPIRSKVRRWMRQNAERGSKLVRKTYLKYPYYALNSVMKDRLLSTDELSEVSNSIEYVRSNDGTVFTIGYEGIHFETWLNKLIRNRVSVLCDVRSNPLSRKFGFSKHMLQSVLPKLDIEYIEFPELGVTSIKRKDLNTKSQYESLFDEYKQGLRFKKDSLYRLNKLVKCKRRIALSCFEADHRYCHRHCISDILKNEFDLKIVHL